MCTDSEYNSQLPQLAHLTGRAPDKTFYLGRVFDNTTNSYKLFWFLALLSLLSRKEEHSILLKDIFCEMATIAWHPVCLYRLSLGHQDKLQDALLNLQKQSQLPSNASADAIRHFIIHSQAAQESLEFIKRYVPTRFLASWFADKLRDQPDHARDHLIKTYAHDSQRTSLASPYWLSHDSINLNNSWRLFFIENMVVVQAFTEHTLTRYLQDRNPNVPGIVNKLHAPTARQLTSARRFWSTIQANLTKVGTPKRFCDIYSGQPLGGSFAIDHFLPWSYVTHDLLWNLTPIEASTNSKKSDSIPDLNLYLPRLASLHLAAIQTAIREPSVPRVLEDYTNCFKLLPSELIALGKDGFTAKYREVVEPQAQIAGNQGFQYGWKLHN